MRHADSRVARRKRGKRAIRELLVHGDLDAVVEHARDAGARRTFRYLLTCVHDADEAVRQRAIGATGPVVAVLADDDLDAVRELVRRLLWWMNDESGALLRVAPEIIAEILIHVHGLVGEYAKLLPRYLTEEPFEPSAHRAVYRLAVARPAAVAGVEPRLRASLDDDDPVVREFAGRALLQLERRAS